MVRGFPDSGTDGAAVIQVAGLTKCYGPVTAVDDLHVTVAAGTVTGFLGRNGSGKTTTLRLLLGLARPTSGRALVFGQPYWRLPAPGRQVGAVLEPAAHPGRTARQHLSLLARPIGVGRHRVDDVLDLVGLAAVAHRKVRGFSLGMRQRLALAGALLGDPVVLVLDEPANGLDPEGIRWLRDYLRDHASRGGTVLMSSHLLAEVQQTVDQVVIIHNGRLMWSGRVAEMSGRFGGGVLVRTREAARLATLLAARGTPAATAGPDALRLPPWSAEQVGLVAAEHRVPLLELREDQLDLEDVFLGLTAATPAPEPAVDSWPLHQRWSR